jgi:hypothetical protein
MPEWLCSLALCLNLDATTVNGCMSRFIRTMHTDYVWHTPTLVVSQCVRGAQFIEQKNSASGWPSARNSCNKNIGLSKLSPDQDRSHGESKGCSYTPLREKCLEGVRTEKIYLRDETSCLLVRTAPSPSLENFWLRICYGQHPVPQCSRKAEHFSFRY